ncbi:eukaryotic translation initiation factor 4B1-like [Asparagus officinalis]|uniref:eukaryotic translation initiation factor 4B1-like n=1 Tax=Asparagus officinalis TaxID=4686 RepID=UPI00098E75C8|nr:eukaryotic translation initiation factor 4B1-like [Asparagus officinalis]
MSKPWGSIGAWALEAKLAETEERELTVVFPPDLFSSLKEAAASSKFLTHDELLRLPTSPKERSTEELEGSHGFRS